MEGPLVLVVDDDPMLRLVCEMTITTGGYRCHCVEGPIQASAALDELPDIQLILSDVRIPGQMDGRTFIERLRLQGIRIPAILTSGYAVDESNLPPRTCFLAKPYTFRSLLDLIKVCLQDP